METFDFTTSGLVSSSLVNNGSQVNFNFNLTDPNPGVTFSVSYKATYFNSNVEAAVNVFDAASAGFTINNFDRQTGLEFGMNNSTAPTTSSIEFELSTATPRSTAFDSGALQQMSVNGTIITGTVINGGQTVKFSLSGVNTTPPAGGGSIELLVASVTFNFLCFCAGTRIATPEGFTLVEDLKPGDLVCVTDGRAVPVKWLGKQPVNTQLTHPRKVNPICITAGALGDSLPERDLRVSQDHAIAIDGHLINAGALVNGTTIYQERETPREGFTYYHVETDAHELILAEGIAAESFIDYAARDAFENGDEGHDRVIEEMDLPRISSARMVPDHIKCRLAPLIAAE